LALTSADVASSPSEKPAAPAATGTTVAPSLDEEISEMKATLAQQARHIQALEDALQRQRPVLDRVAGVESASGHAGGAPMDGDGAATGPSHAAPAVRPESGVVVPALVPAPSRMTAAAVNPCEADSAGGETPTYLRLGNTCIVPIGFMDLTGVWRSTNTGSGIGSNFGSVPYNNAVAGGLSEFRFSAQNSRIGVRVDSRVKSARVTGYLEADFLGFVPTNAAVTSNADTLRMRLYWLNVQKGNWEFLAGQSWSLLTPNRTGLSPLPGDIFYSQVIDTNYMNGLPWTRQPQVRAVYHASKKLTMGVSLEEPEQYIGGSGGGGTITLPSALSSSYASQLNNGSTTISVPNSRPDAIAKVAFDSPVFGHQVHVEIAGLVRGFKVYNQPAGEHFSKTGGGGSANGSFGVTKNFRLVANTFASDGGGRYLFGLAPDTIIRADGSLSLVRAYGTVDGVEANYFKTLFYAYYGGISIGRNTAVDANGKTAIGYGFVGSSNGNNRAIQELTAGFNKTVWKNPRYGAINYMGQYGWILRDPWFAAPGAPRNAHLSLVEFNVRYTLPGDIPKF
jgi:hypothetical protein